MRWAVSGAPSLSGPSPSRAQNPSPVHSSSSPIAVSTCTSTSHSQPRTHPLRPPPSFLFLFLFLFLLLNSTPRFSVRISDGTINYQARQHTLSFTLTPYYNSTPLSFSDAQSTFWLTYVDTLFYTEREGRKTTGLDALGVRPARGVGGEGGEGEGWGEGWGEGLEDPVMPIPNGTFDRLTLDCEGLVLGGDGT